jgi:hypothetical protein
MEYGTQGPPTRGVRPTRGPHETETKQAFKTTEFWIYVVILIGLFIAGLAADGGSDSAIDGFGADHVWLYAVILSVGYMISRGLAKSGSRDPYDPNATTGESLGDRVRAAADVLRGDGEPTTGTHPTQQQPPATPGTTQEY